MCLAKVCSIQITHHASHNPSCGIAGIVARDVFPGRTKNCMWLCNAIVVSIFSFSTTHSICINMFPVVTPWPRTRIPRKQILLVLMNCERGSSLAIFFSKNEYIFTCLVDVVLHTVWNFKTRIPACDCVANPRDRPAIAVIYALLQAGIHRF